MKDHFRSIVLFLLTLEAKAVLKRHKPRVIVVTGSVGKTSTKDAVFTALKKNLFVRKSEKSYNSDIGVPLTILGVPNGWSNIAVWAVNLFKGALLLLSSAPYPEWLVIEVGADRPGDISKSLAWVQPDMVITTKFPEVPVHVEFYASPEDVVKEELFPVSLLKTGGSAVMNADDPYTENAQLSDGIARLTYGFERGADVRGMRYRITHTRGMLTGMSFDVMHGEEKAHVVLKGVAGMAHAYSVLAGIAAAVASGISLQEAAAQFEGHTAPPGRARLIEGKKSSTLIDDSYNSSPAAVEEALATMKSAPCSGKRIAVLGDMLELGTFSASEHTRIGALVPEHADILVTVGVRAKGIAEAARAQGMPETAVHSFERAPDAALFLLTALGAGDAVLVKGSQSMRMERIVKALMTHPEHAPQLLCRQDTEWLSRP